MANEVAVEGMTLGIVQGSPVPVDGTAIVTGIPSIINKVQGDGAYLDQCGISVTNITAGSATIPDVGPVLGNINATIEKVKEQGTKLLIDGDKTGILNATPEIPASPDPLPYPVTFRVEVTNAGQNLVRAK